MGTINVSTLEEVMHLINQMQERIRELKPFDMSFDEVNDFVDCSEVDVDDIKHKLYVIKSINFKFNAPPWREVIPTYLERVIDDFMNEERFVTTQADIFNSVVQELNNEGFEIKGEKDERIIDRIVEELLRTEETVEYKNRSSVRLG